MQELRFFLFGRCLMSTDIHIKFREDILKSGHVFYDRQVPRKIIKKTYMQELWFLRLYVV